MKLIKLALAAFALTVFAIGCATETTNTNQVSNANTKPQTAPSPASTAQASPADEFAQARVVYAENCTVCHGPKGDGGTVKIQGKELKVPSLKEGHALNHNETQLAKQISQGGDGMPAFKDRLKPEVINELVQLIRKEFQAGAPTAAASPAKPQGK